MTSFHWIDTSYLYALFVEKDQYHATARAIWRAYLDRRVRGVTSGLVVAELGNLLACRFGHSVAHRQVSLLFASTLIQRLPVHSDIERRALGWWKDFADQRFSFVDCTSFALMAELGIRSSLSFDTDFSIAGFVTVRTTAML